MLLQYHAVFSHEVLTAKQPVMTDYALLFFDYSDLNKKQKNFSIFFYFGHIVDNF